MTILKTKNLLLLLVIVLAPLSGWYLWGPSGGSLIALNDANFVQFAGEFNNTASDERMLLLVSPT